MNNHRPNYGGDIVSGKFDCNNRPNRFKVRKPSKNKEEKMISLSSYASSKGIQSMDYPTQSNVDAIARHLHTDYPSSPMASNQSVREKAFLSQVAEELKMHASKHNIRVVLP